MTPRQKRNLRMGLSRRDFLRLSGAGLGSAMLSRYLPGASVFAQNERVLREPPPELLPKASSGGLEETELVVASMAGPDINAHVRNGERFTEYTQGKVQVRYDIIGRSVWNESMLTNMRAESDAWDVLAIHLGDILDRRRRRLVAAHEQSLRQLPSSSIPKSTTSAISPNDRWAWSLGMTNCWRCRSTSPGR